MKHMIKTQQEAEIELAKSKLNLILNQGKNPYDLIDKIYQDFYNRTCENCKYYTFFHKTRTYYCDNINTKIGFRQCDVQSDFGCNKWEVKNES